MGRKTGALIENNNLRKVVYSYIKNKDEFYLSEEMVKDIFKEYQLEVLSRPMHSKMKAGHINKFKNIEHRGEVYIRKQISKIINYTKIFSCKRNRNGGASYYERIIN